MKKTTKRTMDRETGEYRVRLFIDGEYQAGADYFTDDLDDAKGTAMAMEKAGGISDKATPEAANEQAIYDAEQEQQGTLAGTLISHRNRVLTKYNLGVHQLCNAANLQTMLAYLSDLPATWQVAELRGFIEKLNQQAAKIEFAIELIEDGLGCGEQVSIRHRAEAVTP